MEQGHKILFILIGIALLAALLGWKSTVTAPTLIVAGASDHPDDVVLGASGAPAKDNISGPDFLTANVPLFFPPPLAHLNPVTSDETGT